MSVGSSPCPLGSSRSTKPGGSAGAARATPGGDTSAAAASATSRHTVGYLGCAEWPTRAAGVGTMTTDGHGSDASRQAGGTERLPRHPASQAWQVHRVARTSPPRWRPDVVPVMVLAEDWPRTSLRTTTG